MTVGTIRTKTTTIVVTDLIKAAEENTKRFIDNPKRKEASEKVAERLNKPKEKKVSKPKDDLVDRLARLLSDTEPQAPDRTELVHSLRGLLTEIEQATTIAIDLIKEELGEDDE